MTEYDPNSALVGNRPPNQLDNADVHANDDETIDPEAAQRNEIFERVNVRPLIVPPGETINQETAQIETPEHQEIIQQFDDIYRWAGQTTITNTNTFNIINATPIIPAPATNFHGLRVGPIYDIRQRVSRHQLNFTEILQHETRLVIQHLICLPPVGYFPPGDPQRAQSRRFLGDIVLQIQNREVHRISAEASMDAFLAGYRFVNRERIDAIAVYMNEVQDTINNSPITPGAIAILRDSLRLAREAYDDFLQTVLPAPMTPVAVMENGEWGVQYDDNNNDFPEEGFEVEIRGSESVAIT